MVIKVINLNALIQNKLNMTEEMKNFILAVKDGNIEEVQRLLEEDNDFIAAEPLIEKDEDTQNLLAEGVDIRPSSGCPFYLAAQYGHQNIIEDLIGRDIHKEDNFKNALTRALIPAVKNNYIGIVKYLIQNGAAFNKYNPLLPLAAKNNNLDMLKYLLSQGADMEMQLDGMDTPYIFQKFNFSALSEPIQQYLEQVESFCKSVYKGDLEAVQSFLAEGFNPNISIIYRKENQTYKKNFYEEKVTPLYLAAEQGDISLVKILIGNHADINLRFPGRDTPNPLHGAAEKGYSEVVRHLVKQGADFQRTITIESSENFEPREVPYQPLHLAAINGHLSIVKYLHEEKGARLDFDDEFVKEHGSIVNEIAKTDHVNVMRYMDQKGLNCQLKDSSGLTPIFTSIDCGKVNMFKFLAELEGNIQTKINYYGDEVTILDLALKRGQIDVIFELLKQKWLKHFIQNQEELSERIVHHVPNIASKIIIILKCIDNAIEIEMQNQKDKDQSYYSPISEYSESRSDIVHQTIQKDYIQELIKIFKETISKVNDNYKNVIENQNELHQSRSFESERVLNEFYDTLKSKMQYIKYLRYTKEFQHILSGLLSKIDKLHCPPKYFKTDIEELEAELNIVDTIEQADQLNTSILPEKRSADDSNTEASASKKQHTSSSTESEKDDEVEVSYETVLGAEPYIDGALPLNNESQETGNASSSISDDMV
ncbi:hypothetical protein phytr_12910 [Candidatus Phycorickettsia trachydisci]|uniref:Uncharacterized protein n=1 Tax=Candidatus Phycorickettsia trachydisci TaxID=2115978 RepID=A0A2P1PAE0_9RICK|nr:ankyrin repeat domain-containing protein [Candidatus Phycorickettsia trachydisci]AVP88215.1 hypothetical protein phytr_12910 [Candidatus Phycorickettsia trachydisci]